MILFMRRLPQRYNSVHLPCNFSLLSRVGSRPSAGGKGGEDIVAKSKDRTAAAGPCRMQGAFDVASSTVQVTRLLNGGWGGMEVRNFFFVFFFFRPFNIDLCCVGGGLHGAIGSVIAAPQCCPAWRALNSPF